MSLTVVSNILGGWQGALIVSACAAAIVILLALAARYGRGVLWLTGGLGAVLSVVWWRLYHGRLVLWELKCDGLCGGGAYIDSPGIGLAVIAAAVVLSIRLAKLWHRVATIGSAFLAAVLVLLWTSTLWVS